MGAQSRAEEQIERFVIRSSLSIFLHWGSVFFALSLEGCRKQEPIISKNAYGPGSFLSVALRTENMIRLVRLNYCT
jgi:hypothetical protein